MTSAIENDVTPASRDRVSSPQPDLDRDEVFIRIRSTMVDMFDLDASALTLETRLVEDLDLDSLDAIDLAVKMQEIVEARVDEVALRKVRTVADVVDLVVAMHRTRS